MAAEALPMSAKRTTTTTNFMVFMFGNTVRDGARCGRW
jgi:hypothetical protein